MTNRLRGVIAPVLTRFDDRLEPDVGRFIAHSRWLVDRHAGLAIFGTNSEAASLSVAERLALTDALPEGGVGGGGGREGCGWAGAPAPSRRGGPPRAPPAASTPRACWCCRLSTSRACPTMACSPTTRRSSSGWAAAARRSTCITSRR